MANQRRPQLQFGGIRIGEAPDVEARPIDAQTPFRILVVGDFSGRGPAAQGDAARLKSCRPIAIDRDNFEQVLARLDVQLRSVLVARNGQETTLAFRELDDFEPDRLIEQVEMFASLRNVRRRLLRTETFADAAAEVRSWQATDSPAKAESPPLAAEPGQNVAEGAEEPAADVDLEGLLDAAVAETPQTAAIHPAQGIIDFERLVAEIVAPYVLDKPDPAQAELVACVDASTAQLLRSLLHHPRFQALEAAWRGLYFLVRRLETDASLKIYLWDVSKADIVADLTAAGELNRSGLYKVLVEQTVGTPGGEPWGIVVGNFEFDATEEDALLAGCLATIAAAAQAPIVAAANPHLYGCESLATATDPDDWRHSIDAAAKQAWRDVRDLSVASSFGLVAPRFMLRPPYGPKSSPIDAFEFNEIPTAEHEAYLWGNGAFALATLLGTTFARSGWKLRPGMAIELDRLPLHFYELDGEQTAKACAEAVLSERALEAIAAAGVMPLASLRDQDRIRLMRFCGLTTEGTALRGKWDG